MKKLILLAVGGMLVALIGGSIALGQEATVDDVRAEFANITQAEVEAMGYVEETPCIDASELPASVLELLNIPSTAGMGIHFINEALIDKTLDPLEPEAIQFGPNGEIWNVEYLTPPQEEPLSILGQTLTFVEEVELDALHLWVIDNPNGQFADFNPAVSCATLDDVRAEFGDLTRSEIEAMGYVVDAVCITAELVGAPAELGAMGFHAVREELFDATVDPLQPELVLLGPNDEVWGVEYEATVETEDPTVLGQAMPLLVGGHPGMEFDHYAMHAWFIDNPAGQFADFNPAASCAPTGAPVTGAGFASSSGGNPWPIALPLMGVTAGVSLLAAGWAFRRRTSGGH